MHFWQLFSENGFKPSVTVDLFKEAQDPVLALATAFIVLRVSGVVLDDDRGEKAKAFQRRFLVSGEVEQFKDGVDSMLRAQVSLQSHETVGVLENFYPGLRRR